MFKLLACLLHGVSQKSLEILMLFLSLVTEFVKEKKQYYEQMETKLYTNNQLNIKIYKSLETLRWFRSFLF